MDLESHQKLKGYNFILLAKQYVYSSFQSMPASMQDNEHIKAIYKVCEMTMEQIITVFVKAIENNQEPIKNKKMEEPQNEQSAGQPIKSQEEADQVFEMLVQLTVNIVGTTHEQAKLRIKNLFDSGELGDLTPTDPQFQIVVDKYMTTEVPETN